MGLISLSDGDSDLKGKRVVIKFSHGEIAIGGARIVGTITEVIPDRNGSFFLHLDNTMYLGGAYKVDDVLVVGIDMNPIEEMFGQSKRSLGLPVLVGTWIIKDEDARKRAIQDMRPPRGEFLGRGEAFVAGTNLSREALRFADATTIPIGLKLNSSDKAFFETFNEIFGFHDARVVSDTLSLKSRTFELLLDYVVSWNRKEGKLKWRKLLLKFEDISSIQFECSDPELGFPHYVMKKIDLKYIHDHDPYVLPNLEEDFHSDLGGAELNAITAQRFRTEEIRFKFDWIAVPKTGNVPIEELVCSKMSLQFTSDVSSE